MTTLTASTLQTDRESINYEVVNADDEFVREGQIQGNFPRNTPWVDVVDELVDRAYPKEELRGWGNGYLINAL
tara:strand:- start:24 stop:242 length:219 start_codon:yes stop_codon:yes gene_type:complete